MLDWEWFSEPSTTSLFLYFLLSANTEDKKWRGMIIKRGQFVTSRKVACDKCGITPQVYRTSLERLISTNEVTIGTTNKFTIITICDYDSYRLNQDLGNQQNNQQNNHN